MKINANSLRLGNIIEFENRLWEIIKTPEHTKPGKGGAYIQVEMRDLKNATKLNHRFGSSENVEKVKLDEIKFNFLYLDGDEVTLMDQENFEQLTINKILLGDQALFLQGNMEVRLEFYNEQVISAKIPEQIVVIIDQTEPVIKGQTVTSSYKPALLENKVRIMVPPFINIGDKVIIRTTDMSYLERAK